MNPGRGEIEALQVRKLQGLLEAILPANPFYQRKLGEGVKAASLEEYSLRLPLTTRHELVKDRLAHPPYGTNLTYSLDRYVRCHQTSGSTTIPIRWLDTAESWNHIVGNWVRILEAAGVDTQDRFFFAFSFGPFLGFWSALEAVVRLGYFCFPGGSMSSLARLQAILDNQITVVCCTPTYALHLGEVARDRQVDLSRCRVRLFIVAGESGGSVPATRSRIEKLWPGATVFDHHGMTEVGPVTYQCPAQPGSLHILESAYWAEVLDPHTTQPVPAGETGELVLTTLDRIGSPLIRYRTGDLVRARSPGVCACGRSELVLEGGILGRSDDMVVVRGVNVYPSQVEQIVRSHPEVLEYRVQLNRQQAMADLSVEVEARDPADGPALKNRLEQSFKAALNLRVPVLLVPPDSLPRFEMKAKRWVQVAS